jgi:hypothetical protein
MAYQGIFMSTDGFVLFKTAIGCCGIVWRGPCSSPTAAPPFVQSAIHDIASLVAGHRVVAASGKTGGFSANGGVATKLRLLAIERSGAPDPQALPDQDTTTPEQDYGFDSMAAVAHLRASDHPLRPQRQSSAGYARCSARMSSARYKADPQRRREDFAQRRAVPSKDPRGD